MESDKVFRHGASWLSSLLQRDIEFVETACGDARQLNARHLSPCNPLPPISLRSRTSDDVVDCKRAPIAGPSSDIYLVFVDTLRSYAMVTTCQSPLQREISKMLL